MRQKYSPETARPLESEDLRQCLSWCHKEGTTHPEVVSTGTPHFTAISDRIRHQPRTKVTGDVDSVARLPSEAGSETEDEEEEAEWEPFVALRN
jgi:hypothetical protein